MNVAQLHIIQRRLAASGGPLAPRSAPDSALPVAGFYLDSSALRSLREFNSGWLRVGAFTSVCTLLELLLGATASDQGYTQSRAAIRQVLDSGIAIVSDTPAVSMARAFPALRAYVGTPYYNFLLVVRLAEFVVENPFRRDFMTFVAEQKLRDLWRAHGLQAIRIASPADDIEPPSRQPQDLPLTTQSPGEVTTTASPAPSATSRGFLHRALEAAGRSGDASLVAHIEATWNSRGEPYLKAFSAHADASFIIQGCDDPDTIGLHHFAYIEPKVRLVTNNKRMADLARQVGLNVSSGTQFNTLLAHRAYAL